MISMDTHHDVMSYWHAEACHGPVDGPDCRCSDHRRVLLPMLAQAWDAGHRSGRADTATPLAIRRDPSLAEVNPYQDGGR